MKTTIKSAIVALALAVTVSASANSYMFNTNLRQGQRGADVTALQTKLGVTPATGFFGPMTRNAVRAYQTANSIPSTGFVGPMTRAALNSTTSTTPTVPGTTPTTPVVLNGQEGFAEYRLSPTPVNNTNVQISNDVPVYGIEVKAKNADISVERITLNAAIQNTVTGSYENPSTLINSISVKDGSTVLATIPVNSSTFSKITGTFAYNVQISGLSTKVAKDTIKTFTVHFNTNSIDSARSVVLDVSANGVRVVDGRGISTYNGPSNIDSRTHVFKKPGNSTITVRGDATTIYSSNNRVNNLSNGAEKVLTSTFAVKSESGASKITDVVVTVATGTVASTMPTNLYLFQGSTLLDSRTVPASGIVMFDIDNSNVSVAQDQTTTFTVRADLPATTVQGSLVKTTVTSVIFDRADGSSTTLGASVDGPFHFFATVVPTFTKVSSTLSQTVAGGSTTSSTTILTAAFSLNLTANGGDINVATTSATIALRNTASGVVTSAKTVFGTTDSGITTFTDGSSRVIRFVPTWTNSELPGTGNYQAIIQSVKYATSTTAQPFTLPGGFEFFDTNDQTIVK